MTFFTGTAVLRAIKLIKSIVGFWRRSDVEGSNAAPPTSPSERVGGPYGESIARLNETTRECIKREPEAEVWSYIPRKMEVPLVYEKSTKHPPPAKKKEKKPVSKTKKSPKKPSKSPKKIDY